MTDFRDHPDPIRFNVPAIEGNELAYLEESLRGGHTSAGGPFSKRAAAILQEEAGSEEVLLTTSCTAALELSALLLDLQPGDTVVVPSFTFSTSALAFAARGARLVFCDIERSTLGLDPGHLGELLDDSVRAVVVVHYGGVACDLDGIQAVLADRPEVVLIEDNAHGLFGRWRGRPLGSFGGFASLSFHETKNVTCGEGGALLVNDPAMVDRARVLYDKGTNRRAFFLGQVDKYSWIDTGSSFGLSDTLAAQLTAQLECREKIQAKRRHVYESYLAALAPIVEELAITLPVVPEGCDPAYHLFHVLMPDRSTRDRVMDQMRSEGINPTFHYVPLHSSVGGRRFAARETDCPVTTDVSDRLLRMPYFNDLTEAQVERVTESFVRTTKARG
ncbi:MAG: dTDP-4-amino-4,6-dideoxygalactose transaminase [Nocardioides sp.]|nr:dTDP-4-amino-4,6-dideoxygalactose transaminase [Nocardioides sp.]